MLGRLVAGCRADMVAFEPKRVEVLATWVAGSEGGVQEGTFTKSDRALR
jgi:hypothetical protein